MFKLFKHNESNKFEMRWRMLFISVVLIALYVSSSMTLVNFLDKRFNMINNEISNVRNDLLDAKKEIDNNKENISTIVETVNETKDNAKQLEVVSCQTYEAVPAAPATDYYDVPLSTDLQDHIFKLCEQYKNVEPSIIISIIYKESTYNTTAMGDGGEAYGLMQIQPRWHQERINRLGVTDLLNPYQNVTVGIDYLSDLMGTGKTIEWALMAYNGGPSYANRKTRDGVITEYASKVLEYSSQLN